MAVRKNPTLQKDFQALRGELQSARAYFKDPDFPPEARSLYFSGRVPKEIGAVTWKRARDVCRNPRFIFEGAQRHDLDQGLLGNCWFIAGAATVATADKALFERVVPPDQDFDQNYAGIFHFNFWWYGTWTEIVVDDYLPTDGRDLIYCHNRERPDEMWPALLEKAYAKLRGCYESLDGGKLQDSMVDLTGGISEVISLQEKSKVTYDLYDLLLRSFSMKSMLGAAIFRPEGSTESEVEMSNGLYMGHAYSITGFQQLKTSRGIVRLLRIRNPWGRGEWKGAWSDGSPEMLSLPPNIKAEMDIRNVDEGEFWITFDDFVKNFDELQLCHLQIDAMIEELRDNQNKQNWNVTVYHDEWIRGVTAGGCGNPPNERLYWSNPQFYLNLSKTDTVLSDRGECTVIISLMEKEMNNQSTIAIGFDVYRLTKPDLRPLNERRAPKNALLLERRSGTYQFYREVTKRLVLKPGHYVIVASTFSANEEAKFMLRIFTEKYINSKVMEEQPDMSGDGKPPILSPKDFVYDLFTKIAGSDNQLDAAELQTFLSAVSEEDVKKQINFSVEQCRSLLPMMDESRTGRLGINEAKRLWKDIKAYREVFLQFDRDKSNSVDTYELTTMFNKLGGPFLLLLRDTTELGPDGFPVSRPVLTSIVRRYGDRNNRIALEDFIVIIFRLIELFKVYQTQEQKSGRSGVAEFSRNEFLQHTMYL